jgi:hypothetical protein
MSKRLRNPHSASLQMEFDLELGSTKKISIESKKTLNFSEAKREIVNRNKSYLLNEIVSYSQRIK